MCDCNNSFSCQPWVCLPELGTKITAIAQDTALEPAALIAPGDPNPLEIFAKLVSIHCVKIKCPPVLEIKSMKEFLTFLDASDNAIIDKQKIIRNFIKGVCPACSNPACVC